MSFSILYRFLTFLVLFTGFAGNASAATIVEQVVSVSAKNDCKASVVYDYRRAVNSQSGYQGCTVCKDEVGSSGGGACRFIGASKLAIKDCNSFCQACRPLTYACPLELPNPPGNCHYETPTDPRGCVLGCPKLVCTDPLPSPSPIVCIPPPCAQPEIPPPGCTLSSTPQFLNNGCPGCAQYKVTCGPTK